MNLTFDKIQPLLAQTQEEASYISVIFRCPATGAEVRAQGPWPADGLMRASVQRTRSALFSNLRNSIAMSVTRATGTGLLGRLTESAAINAVQQVGRDRENQVRRTDADRQAAIIAAFQSVHGQFRWDDRDGRWLAASAAEVERSAFDEHLSQFPLATSYDAYVLRRFLAALIAADGVVEDTEREVFAELVPGVALDELLQAGPLSAADFTELSSGPSRDTIILFGWVVALADGEAGAEETVLLDNAARWSGISPERAAELRHIAQLKVVDDHLAGADPGHAVQVRADVEALAQRIRLDRDEAVQRVIRWQKRLGVRFA